MRFILSFIVLSIVAVSCRDEPAKPPLNEQLAGYWLVLYPQHKLKTPRHQELYNREVQDSITSLLGLKFVRFEEGGTFLQTDSIFASRGKWSLGSDSQFLIDQGGKGLDMFAGKLMEIQNDTLQIMETMWLKGEKIPLIWHLKKITESDRMPLFDIAFNQWRIRPIKSETKEELQKRVKGMLTWYSLYFSVVSKESAFFTQSRVTLPFLSYQHSIGLRPFSHSLSFNRFFFDNKDALEAHSIISTIMENDKQLFPRGKDFVIEYARYMARLAESI